MKRKVPTHKSNMSPTAGATLDPELPMNLPDRTADDLSVPTNSNAALPVDGPPVASSSFAISSPLPSILAPRLIRSRRKRWLSLNSSYFTSASADLELSGDALVGSIFSWLTTDIQQIL